MSNIGFIGLGIMGRPMAAHLIAGGHTVFLATRRGVPAELLEAGGVPCRSPRDVAARAEIVITMVPDTPDVADVLFGENGAADAMTSSQVLIDMSSISPIETRAFAERLQDRTGARYADAPVSGGEVGAKAASLTIMVGADGHVFSTIRPILALMGKNITHVGGVGAGQVCKVANQMIVALTIEAVAEALLLASRTGVDPARVREALMGGFAASRVLEVHGERMIRRTFDPGFRVDLHRKDLGLALATARGLGLCLPNSSTTQELFNACSAQGRGGDDHSALATVLEGLANHPIAR